MMIAPMPSPFGHALAGLAIANLFARDGDRADPYAAPNDASVPGRALAGAAPPVRPWWQAAVSPWTAACVICATLPDADLLVGAHRGVSHSIGAVAVVTIVAAAVTGWVTGRAGGAGRAGRAAWIAAMCGAAYASHILLDWLGADTFPPAGIQALWPISRAWVIAPWPIFPMTERHQLFTVASLLKNLIAAGVEAAVLGPIVALTWIRRTRRSRVRSSDRDGRRPPCGAAAGTGGTWDPQGPGAAR